MKDTKDSYIGKECFWVDKVTLNKIYDGKPLGICIGESLQSLHNLPIVWFKKPFQGFTWQYKSNVRLRTRADDKYTDRKKYTNGK